MKITVKCFGIPRIAAFCNIVIIALFAVLSQACSSNPSASNNMVDLFDKGEDTPLLADTMWVYKSPKNKSATFIFESDGSFILSYSSDNSYFGFWNRVNNTVTWISNLDRLQSSGQYSPRTKKITGTEFIAAWESPFTLEPLAEYSKEEVIASASKLKNPVKEVIASPANVNSSGTVQNSSNTVINSSAALEGAVERAADQALKNVTQKSVIAIVYITAQDRSTTDFVSGELEFIWVNKGFIITDRSELDRLRREQNFQLSGEVDDATAVSIGRFAGADIIVTGKVDGEGDLRRLRIRAINTQTAQVVGNASERFGQARRNK
jgi:hypothetical protein